MSTLLKVTKLEKDEYNKSYYVVRKTGSTCSKNTMKTFVFLDEQMNRFTVEPSFVES